MAIVTIVTPFLVFLGAVYWFFGNGISALDLGLCMGMYAVTMLGITLGYHRLFTHRSFKCVAAVKAFLGIAGGMSAQGPVIFWCACHRKHHRHSDEEGDPHSPHYSGGGWRGILKGCWHSHVGWMLGHAHEPYFRLVPDLIRDRMVLRLSQLYFWWVVAGIVLPGVLGGLWTQSWAGFFTGVLWGGFVRLFLVHHSTWSINSVCHLFGARNYDTGDESRNNLVCALLTFGEGWHNNHHAFPTSARHGLRWWQLDVVYLLICSLRIFGLVWDVRLPDEIRVEGRPAESV